ncbi:fasciclin domain-containing protein [Rhodococcus coprophilus]|uniref:Fasciclin-like lipoprotein n=1 Tax=Rhodococcus coprophilus TaxID=38310 RepID=A0A2X4U0P9_9NOCA|nr:fasciclin domain-containing protein [Rhodococcus coprophilus]MBM7458751.1 putative surface protein with fasciclin (FAS1) repeats [Rhodococcus coprophilus]SQI33356.1 fasciclin-like lipoprotein [Rhodococcus coprophilus]
MKIATRKSLAIIGIGAMSAFGVAACSSDDSGSSSDTSAATTTTSSAMETTESTSAQAAAAGPVGPGCAAYVEANPTGPASVEELSTQTITEAAGNVPVLTTLTQAVSGQLNPDVNLVETLDGGEYTVFAPVDDAFAALDPATIETLKTDSGMLTDILTYHVVPGELTIDDVAGTQTTVEGGTVEVTGSGDMWTVNGANVICGGIETENGVVYLIDGVLTPPQ